MELLFAIGNDMKYAHMIRRLKNLKDIIFNTN